MIDIKSILEDMKNDPSRKKELESLYKESVDKIKNNPTDFLLQLEYIITSGYGLKTFENFITEHSIPLTYYGTILDLLKEKHELAESAHMNPNPYNNIIHQFESFMKVYPATMAMIGKYSEYNDDNYISEYYKFIESSDPSKLYSRYGKLALADIVHIESSMNDETSFIESAWNMTDPEVAEVLFNIISEGKLMKEYSNKLGQEEMLNIFNHIFEASYTSKVAEIESHEKRAIEDSLMRMESSFDEDIQGYHYTKEDLHTYEEYNSFIQEKMISGLVSLDEATSVAEKLVYIEEMIDMEERGYPDGYTTNKKTGHAPDYLKMNHDLQYGEDDRKKEKDTDSDLPEAEPNEDNNEYDMSDNKKSEDKDDPWSLDEPTKKHPNGYPSTVYNYHYYNSFNSKNDSDNVSYSNDHSNRSKNTNIKHINSHNKTIDNQDNDNKNESVMLEKKYPYKKITIDNSESSAIKSGSWKDPGAALYDRLLNSFDGEVADDADSFENDIKSGKIKQWDLLLKEAYLIAPVSDIKNSPYGVTPYSRSGCKYPHHMLRNGKLVVSIPGLKAAYSRACQQKIFNGDVKDHLMRHFREMKMDSYLKENGELCFNPFDEIDELINSNNESFNDTVDENEIHQQSMNNIGNGVNSDNDKIYTNDFKKNIMISAKEKIHQDDDWWKDIDTIHPKHYQENLQTTMQDIDRATLKFQQSMKKGVQNTVKAGKAVAKPFQRTSQWINNTINEWKDKDENAIKAKMADPHSRSSLMGALKKAIAVGSFAKAGLLFNPIFLFLSITKHVSTKSKSFRLRNEIIGELKTELKILDEKINDARDNHDNKEKYQMMRIKNELEKKLLRVSGGKQIAKII